MMLSLVKRDAQGAYLFPPESIQVYTEAIKSIRDMDECHEDEIKFRIKFMQRIKLDMVEREFYEVLQQMKDIEAHLEYEIPFDMDGQ